MENHTFEVVEYTQKLPFRMHNITKREITDEYRNAKDILEHWHPEIEIVYTFAGHARHYIDGSVHVAEPGSLFVINSESIHKVVSDINIEDTQDIVAAVLMVNYEFVKSMVPMLRQMYFLPKADTDKEQIKQIMLEFSEYADGKRVLKKHEELKLMSMIYRVMYLLCTEALVLKESVLPVNNQKNLERLRGVMQYVSKHYREPVTQWEVAERFYFTKEYFSRFFKKNTGMTFTEYLARYRVSEAKNEIMYSDKTILAIALDHGFTDARGLIQAFKAVYKMTPLQYRKQAASAKFCNFSDNLCKDTL